VKKGVESGNDPSVSGLFSLAIAVVLISLTGISSEAFAKGGSLSEQTSAGRSSAPPPSQLTLGNTEILTSRRTVIWPDQEWSQHPNYLRVSPGPQGQIHPESRATSSPPACRDLTDFLHGRTRAQKADGTTLDPFLTDGALVVKSGQAVFETYGALYRDPLSRQRFEVGAGEIPSFNEHSVHVLWSATKPVTAVLLERAIQSGARISVRNSRGQEVQVPLSLNLSLAQIFSLEEILADPYFLTLAPGSRRRAQLQVIANYNSPAFRQTTLEHLVNMSVPFDWNEYYEEDLKNSTFLPMLYLGGRMSMAGYALSRPFQIAWQTGESPRLFTDWPQNLAQDQWAQTLRSLVPELRSSLFQPRPYHRGPWRADWFDRSTYQDYLNLPESRAGKLDDFRFEDAIYGPGVRTRYSGGASNLIQKVLRKVYGQNYDEAPWRLLFDKLQFKNAIWEKDESGLFVGSSYLYLRVRDMAKFGYLFLRGGFWKNELLLSSDWVFKAKTPAATLTNPITTPGYIKKLGVQTERVFWANAEVISYGEVALQKEFPSSPDDLFFAAGHYGQLIIVIPSLDMVIARTGHDLTYWNHIDAFIQKTLGCVNALTNAPTASGGTR
jgi:CubicO group peptidase (beta-lactamase class C family)